MVRSGQSWYAMVIQCYSFRLAPTKLMHILQAYVGLRFLYIILHFCTCFYNFYMFLPCLIKSVWLCVVRCFSWHFMALAPGCNRLFNMFCMVKAGYGYLQLIAAAGTQLGNRSCGIANCLTQYIFAFLTLIVPN